MKKNNLNFFFCPGSDYLNQYNETGSHGQISYQFISNLAKKKQVASIFATVIMTLVVTPIAKTKIVPLKKRKQALSDYDSLYFYVVSFFKFFRSKYYKNADVVHHIIPFALGRSFNLLFFFKDKQKKYIIGPIIGPHTNTEITADEEYVFKKKTNFNTKIKNLILSSSKKILLGAFGKVLEFISIKTLQRADIVFFSDNHALSYHKKFLLPHQKGIILDTGIDTSVFKPSTKKLLPHKEISILFVGRLTKRKGCEYLIKAIHEAKSMKGNISLHCYIFGVGPLQEELEQLVKKLQIERFITFLGGAKTNEEIVSYYHKTDIVCLPALSETFTVTKEALACGKPVIVTDTCSNAERIEEGITGFIVPPKNAKAIAKVLVQLSNNPSQLKKLSENAIKKRSLFDWQKITDRYLQILYETK